MRSYGVILGAALLAAGAPAQTPREAPTTPAATKPESGRDKRVCRTEVVTGSLVQKRRICQTVAERDARAKDAQGMLGSMAGPNCGNLGCN